MRSLAHVWHIWRAWLLPAAARAQIQHYISASQHKHSQSPSPHTQNEPTAESTTVPNNNCCHVLSVLSVPGTVLSVLHITFPSLMTILWGRHHPHFTMEEVRTWGHTGKTGIYRGARIWRQTNLPCGTSPEGRQWGYEQCLQQYPYGMHKWQFLRTVSYSTPQTVHQSTIKSLGSLDPRGVVKERGNNSPLGYRSPALRRPTLIQR